MLSRVFNTPRRSPPPSTGETSLHYTTTREYADFVLGYIDDIPLISVDRSIPDSNKSFESQVTLGQILRASVGVMGESPLGMTEKVIMSEGRIFIVKRFRRVCVKKKEFGKRIESIARLGNQCKHLVPVAAYLYAKRIKFVVSDYYPMGSLADLLFGAREQGQSALKWNYRFKIIQSVAKAIAFIHSQDPTRGKGFALNIHGNIKSSNVMINVDFSACLADYGFAHVAVHDTGQIEQASERIVPYENTVLQESDVYNFGVIMLDTVGWPSKSEMSEFNDEEKEEALKVLDVALSCTNSLPQQRPNIHQVITSLENIPTNLDYIYII